MIPWQTVATAVTDEGKLELRRRGESEFLIVIGGRVLMNSTSRSSEEALAQFICPIGGRYVRDKRPAVIAALAAAEILAHVLADEAGLRHGMNAATGRGAGKRHGGPRVSGAGFGRSDHAA